MVVGVVVYIYENTKSGAPVFDTTNQHSNQTQQTNSQNTSPDVQQNASNGVSENITTSPRSGLKTYDNFGIAFQYPAEWGLLNETLNGNGLFTIFFDNNSSAQPFRVSIEQDMDLQGTVLHETLDQMITRFRRNDEYIYQVKNISADGVQGREMFFDSALTGQPYHVDAYFPFQNNFYISLGADYQSVSQTTLDSIISTVKWDSATAFRQDSATGMGIYGNNGIRFEYPVKFNTDFASLTVGTSVKNIDGSELDDNGCFPVTNDNGKPSPSNVFAVNGIKFCSTKSADVGAGQLYTDYIYTTHHNGNVYTIDYSVHTSNGCSVYENSPDPNASGNEKYKECLDFEKKYDSIVTEPIHQSISTFRFTE